MLLNNAHTLHHNLFPLLRWRVHFCLAATLAAILILMTLIFIGFTDWHCSLVWKASLKLIQISKLWVISNMPKLYKAGLILLLNRVKYLLKIILELWYVSLFLMKVICPSKVITAWNIRNFLILIFTNQVQLFILILGVYLSLELSDKMTSSWWG